MPALSESTRASRVFVLGSLNVDLQVSVASLPRPGETVMGDDLRLTPGGKGGNQAVAAARLGAAVAMIGCVGADDHGQLLLDTLAHEGVDTRLVEVESSARTGTALILVAPGGENMIAVSAGANASIQASDAVRALAEIALGDLLVLQLEIPLEAVHAATEQASARGARVILNAAPALDVDAALLDSIDLLIVNAGEARTLFGSVEDTLATGRPTIVTLGPEGAIMTDGRHELRVPAPRVEPLDTTGAGDAFVGAIASELARGRPLMDAAHMAVTAGATATLAYGGQSALPRRDELVTIASNRAVAS